MFEIEWERHVGSTAASFRDSLSSRSNNYTVTGLKGYDNATFSVTVTAYNAAGSATSPRVNVAANFASGNTQGDDGSSGSSSSSGNDEAVIGTVLGGLVILAIAVVVVAILVYHYKSKSKRNNKNAVYS